MSADLPEDPAEVEKFEKFRPGRGRKFSKISSGSYSPEAKSRLPSRRGRRAAPAPPPGGMVGAGGEFVRTRFKILKSSANPSLFYVFVLKILLCGAQVARIERETQGTCAENSQLGGFSCSHGV